jgi:hypothetical protein
MSTFFESNFWAAITGAIVGGTVTLIMQLIQNRHARGERDAERKDIRKAVCRSLLSKLVRMQNQFLNFIANHDQCKAKAPSEFEPWQYMQALGALPELVTISSEELAIVMEMDGELFNTILRLSERYSVAAATHLRYDRDRREFSATLNTVGGQGPFASYELTAEDFAKSAPWRNFLNQTVEDMHKYNLDDAAEGKKILDRLVGLMNEKFQTSITWQDRSGVKLTAE